MAAMDERAATDGDGNRKKWSKPVIESDTIYETQALGCAQCPSRPRGAVGIGDGNCWVTFNNY